MKKFAAFYVIWTIVGIFFWAAVIFVALHFITKWW